MGRSDAGRSWSACAAAMPARRPCGRGSTLPRGCTRPATTADARRGRAAAPPTCSTRYAPAIVRVEAVLETRLNLGGQGEAEDSRLDLLGAVVDPQGLVMIWNSHISSARMSEMMAERRPRRRHGHPGGAALVHRHAARGRGAGAARRHRLGARPGVPAARAAAGASRCPSSTSRAAARPAVGDALLAVSRLGRGFDHAPVRADGAHRRPAQEAARGVHPRRQPHRLRPAGVRPAPGAPVGALTTVVTRGARGRQRRRQPDRGPDDRRRLRGCRARGRSASSCCPASASPRWSSSPASAPKQQLLRAARRRRREAASPSGRPVGGQPTGVSIFNMRPQAVRRLGGRSSSPKHVAHFLARDVAPDVVPLRVAQQARDHPQPLGRRSFAQPAPRLLVGDLLGGEEVERPRAAFVHDAASIPSRARRTRGRAARRVLTLSTAIGYIAAAATWQASGRHPWAA